ncbi:MAG: type IV secretion system DNA-binding domain-containing protein [Candidatus Shapirobacteria bacterium]|nr:type IV secretion system DNA-binding domain-containing protein [Candidatus Shapirobacteria bacterium]MDD5073645.1 type IV secretion system DNA-binding domain-containing protein [Candidatus Shapirobacteria bacterium]
MIINSLNDLFYLLIRYFVLGGAAVFFLFLLGFLIYFLFLLWRERNREQHSLDLVLLQVILPRDNEIKIDAAEQLFTNLHSLKVGGKLAFLKPKFFFTAEIVGTQDSIRFYFAIPQKKVDLLERQIYGLYPTAVIKRVDEYNIFSKDSKVAYAVFEFKNSPFYPIKTYQDFSVDPLSSLASTLSKLIEGEGVAIQILIAPTGSKWQKLGRSFLSSTKKKEADPEKAEFKVDSKTLEQIDEKCSRPGFEVELRVVVCSKSIEQAKAHLSSIKSALSQFSSDQNGFSSKKIWWKRTFMIDFIYRYRPLWPLNKNRIILNSAELATIFHLPNKTVETPNIAWLNAKRAPVPPEVPKSGLYLGKSVHRGEIRSVCLSEDDRRRHVYIIGKTGTGKSELLKQMIVQDIEEGKGVCFIDPHDTIEKILPRIPAERAEDVIYFDPSDTSRPMGLNLLEAYTEEQKNFVVSSIINLMYKLYDPYKTGIIGPRFEHAIRNAMLTVMTEPGATFVEVVRALTDASYVRELLPKLKDPMVRRYWTDQIAQTSDFHKSEVLDYIVSKFGRFVTDSMMRNIIGQSQSAFDFRKVMDEGKILLINLAKGKIGEENSSFLGLVLIPKLLIAAMSRQDIPEDNRRDFYLYVDEFQNFATPDFAQILSEARKYHLNLTVANQFIGQMDEEVKNAVFGNVGTLVSFRVGVADASYLQHELQPDFSENDLLNIERFNAYVKTIVNNEPVPPFSLDLTKDMAKEKALDNWELAKNITELSRLKYAQDRALIEAQVARRAKL